MMQSIPNHYRTLFRDHVMPREGGYKPEHFRPDRTMADKETFLGNTITSWQDLIGRLDRNDIAALPTELRTRINAIQQASDEQKPSLTSDLLKFGARLTDPYGDATTQPATGMPIRSLHTRASDNTPAEDRVLGAFHNLAQLQFHQRYVLGEGFQHYPARIQDDIVDFGIVGGPARARWAAVKAMSEAGIITQDEFNSFPYVTSSQANNKEAFKNGPAAAYATIGLNNRILEHLRDATPAQLATMEARFNAWQLTYNRVLAQEDSAFRDYEAGWRARIEARAGLSLDNAIPTAPEPRRADAPAPARAPSREQRFTTAPAENEVIALDVQFRRGGGNLGGGTFGLNDAIAIEIPGRGVFTYATTHNGNYVTNNAPAPNSGIQLLRAVDQGTSGDGLRNPYRYPTVTWLDPHGHRIYLPLTPEFAQQVRRADIGLIISSTGDFVRDHTGLAHSSSNQIQIRPSSEGARFQVLDMDKPSGNGVTAYNIPAPPRINDRSPS